MKSLIILLVSLLAMEVSCQSPTSSPTSPTQQGSGFKVIYNANATSASGGVPTDSNGYAQGASVTVLGNTKGLALSGYQIAGWNTQANGLGTSYAVGATFSIGSADVNLYAVWLPSNLKFTGSGTTLTITGYTTAPTGTLVVPAGITAIGGVGAFYNCTNLTGVSFPASLTSLGTGAFEQAGLTTVSIPATLTSVGLNAFTSCQSLTSITVETANPNYQSIEGVLFNKAGTILIQAPGALAGTYSIPGAVTTLADWAFNNCKSLTGITGGTAVTSVGIATFQGCSALASATLSGTITTLGTSAFEQCSALTSLTLPSNLVTIGEYAFHACSGLAAIIIPASVTTIQADAFENCTALTTVTIPAGVTSLGDGLFFYCSGLTAITVALDNPNYSSDSFGVLYNKTKTDLIEAPAKLAAAYTTVPSTVTSIHYAAFGMCKNLTTLTLPVGLTALGTNAFNSCTGLTSVTLQAHRTSGSTVSHGGSVLRYFGQIGDQCSDGFAVDL